MARVVFLLLVVPIWLLSLLPLRVHYLFAGFISWVLSSVLRYRKDVVFINLARSFPEYKYDKIREISRKFYKNFADTIVENVWVVSASLKRMKRMGYVENPEVVKEVYEKGKPVIFVSGHQGNWEFFPYIPTFESGDLIGFSKADFRFVYKRQHSGFMDRLMKWVRMRGGDYELIESNSAARQIIKNKDNLACYFLLADQVPLPGSKFTVDFLNRETLMMNGPEMIALKTDIPVVFVNMEKEKRGKYCVRFSLITESPSATASGEITTKYAALLEESIRRMPENWLWSHRRWKRGVEDNVLKKD
jgi:Lauroyl/myristoyl acyltransferase